MRVQEFVPCAPRSAYLVVVKGEAIWRASLSVESLTLGVTPRSWLIIEAQARLMLMGQASAAEIQALQAQVTELENRFRICEQRRQEMREILLRLIG